MTDLITEIQDALYDKFNDFMEHNNYAPEFTISFSPEGRMTCLAERDSHRVFNNKGCELPTTFAGYPFDTFVDQIELFKIHVVN